MTLQPVWMPFRITTRTAPDGSFSFDGLSGRVGYEVRVRKGALVAPPDGAVHIREGHTTETGLSVLSKALPLTVEVQDGAGRAVAGATVRVYRAHDPLPIGSPRPPLRWWVRSLAPIVPLLLGSAETDDRGVARLRALPAGNCSVTADGTGLGREVVNLKLTPATATVPVTVRVGRGYSLTGTVVDARGRLAKGRVLAIRSGDGLDGVRGQSSPIDGKGRYHLDHLAQGVVQLVVLRPGLPALPAGTVVVPDLGHFDVHLAAGAEIEGTILGPDGSPLEGVRVLFELARPLRRHDMLLVASAVTDAHGGYRVSNLPPGDVTLRIVKPGYVVPARSPGLFGQRLWLASGTSLRADVRLARGGRISGRVTRKSDGAPIPGARVICREGTAVTDAKGDYAISSLPPGEYFLHVVAAGYFQPGVTGATAYDVHSDGTVSIGPTAVVQEPGERVKRDLVVGRGVDLLGRIVDALGLPVPGAPIRVWGRSAEGPRVFSNAQGVFRVGGVVPRSHVQVGVSRAPFGDGRRVDDDHFWDGAHSPTIDTSVAGVSPIITLQTQPERRIAGFVVLPDGRRATRGRVRMDGSFDDGWHAVADNGWFQIDDPADVYSSTAIGVDVEVPGYPTTVHHGFPGPVGPFRNLGAVRVRRGTDLTGVVERASGRPVGSAEVIVRFDESRECPPCATALTNRHGRFCVKGLARGRGYDLLVTKPGLGTIRRDRVDPASGSVRFEFSDEGVSGRVVDPDGERIEGVRLELTGRDRTGNIRKQTGSDVRGRFRFPQVPRGSFTLMASPPSTSLNLLPAKIEGVHAGAGGVVVRLARGGEIRGRLVDEHGDGVPFADVSAEQDGRISPTLVWSRTRAHGDYSSPLWTQTSAKGEFEFRALAPGVYDLSDGSSAHPPRTVLDHPTGLELKSDTTIRVRVARESKR